MNIDLTSDQRGQFGGQIRSLILGHIFLCLLIFGLQPNGQDPNVLAMDLGTVDLILDQYMTNKPIWKIIMSIICFRA